MQSRPRDSLVFNKNRIINLPLTDGSKNAIAFGIKARRRAVSILFESTKEVER